MLVYYIYTDSNLYDFISVLNSKQDALARINEGRSINSNRVEERNYESNGGRHMVHLFKVNF